MTDEQDPNGQEPINPWDVPEGQMVPMLTCVCPRCKGQLGVPIQITPLGVTEAGEVITIESEEDAQRIKGVLFNLMVPVERFMCPGCTGQAPKPEDGPEPAGGSRIITL